MKTKIYMTTIGLFTTLLMSSLPALAHNNNDDRNNDYAYYIMSPKKSNNKRDESWLRIISKSGEIKSVNFNGTVQVPDSIKVNAGLQREGVSQVFLVFDNVQCKYETKVSRRFFNFTYPLVSCSDGSRAKEEMRVSSRITFYLKEAKSFPAAAYASIKVIDKFVRGISLPQLESEKGQILRFDGELWVPTDYIPDGQAAGDVLVWDGVGWAASKISGGSGSAGEKGDKGDKGDSGPQGPAGIAGVSGAMGPQGIKGDKGDKGDTGAQGPVGAAGAVGPIGLQGLKGDKGDAGAQGPAGVMGAAGAQGPAGAAGAVGPIGPQGLKGDKGDKGEPGLVSLTAGNGILGETILGNGGVIAVNTGTASGQIPVIGASGKLPSSIIPDAVLKMAIIKDVKASGSNGGSCDSTKGWEQVRDLNSISGDLSIASLAANQITLQPGTYVIEAEAPAYLDGFHKAILVNAQTGEIVIVGSNARSHNVAGGMEPSKIIGQVVITEPTIYVVKHRCASSMANIGFGSPMNFGVEEVYTQVKITKAK